MEKLVARLRLDYPQLAFAAGAVNCWSPHSNQISYSENNDAAKASIIHELAHALLGHLGYASDLELLRKEVAAWNKATQLASRYEVIISDDHVQACLDTYRDWVHRRSLCPVCNLSGLQQKPTTYYCPNCLHRWHVTAQRLSRPYRRSPAKEKVEV